MEPQTSANAEPGRMSQRGVHVAAGRDRFGEPVRLGPNRLDTKVSGRDSNGGLYIFESADLGKGGPPLHLHHEQDEWFYVTKGQFKFVVGREEFTLKAGDSLFAPRKVPHTWACVSEEPGTMLLGLQPAGRLEDFFGDFAKLPQQPTEEQVGRVFEAHGMTVVGAPLRVD